MHFSKFTQVARIIVETIMNRLQLGQISIIYEEMFTVYKVSFHNKSKQAGAELCQAQGKLKICWPFTLID